MLLKIEIFENVFFQKKDLEHFVVEEDVQENFVQDYFVYEYYDHV